TLTRLMALGTRWWDQVALPRALARDGAQIFLSPYYKAPLVAPCPVVVTIHDLFFIGYGGRRSLRDPVLTAAARLYARRARALVVADSVVFAGRIDDADLPGLYSACAAFVLPSLEEGFGLPAVEAMACGAPVIVSDRGALPEVAGPGAAVLDAADAGALAAGLARVLREGEYREALRRRGRARAADFTPARTAGGVLDLLERVVGAALTVARW